VGLQVCDLTRDPFDLGMVGLAAIRGYAYAVMFLGASSELWQFRAGMSAWAFDAVPAVLVGGAATIGVSSVSSVVVLAGAWRRLCVKADVNPPVADVRPSARARSCHCKAIHCL
jgi:hypothetical protein